MTDEQAAAPKRRGRPRKQPQESVAALDDAPAQELRGRTFRMDAADDRAFADERSGLRAAQGPKAPPAELPRARPPRELEERRSREGRLDVMDGRYDYRLKVTVPQDPNYTYRWEIDEPGVLGEMQRAYWELVPEQERYFAYSEGGESRYYVLIRKWRDWYVQDQQPRRQRDKAVMDQIRSGRALEDFGNTSDGQPAQYLKDSRGRAVEVSVGTSRR